MNQTRRTFIASSFGSAFALMSGGKLAAQLASGPVTSNFPHILFGRMGSGGIDSWTTEFSFTNVGPSPANVALRWFGDDGSPLSVPVIGAGRTTRHSFQIPINTTINLQLDPSSDAITQGWVAVDIAGAVEGQAQFHWSSPGRPEYSSAVPMNRQGSQAGLIVMAGGIPVTPVSSPRSLALRFNNVGHVTGIAFANTQQVPNTLNLEFVDSVGNLLMPQVIPIGPLGHVSLATTDARLWSSHGLVRVVGDGSPFSALAMDFDMTSSVGPYSAFVPLLR